MRITVKVKDLLPGDVLCGSGYTVHQIFNNFAIPKNMKNKTEVIYSRAGETKLWKAYWGKTTTMMVERN